MKLFLKSRKYLAEAGEGGEGGGGVETPQQPPQESGLESAIKKERQARQAAEKRLKDIESKYNFQEIDEIIANRQKDESDKQKFERQLSTATTQAQQYRQRFEKLSTDMALSRAVTELKGQPTEGLLLLLRHYLGSALAVSDEGEVQVDYADKTGKPLDLQGAIEELIGKHSDLKVLMPHYNQNSGSGTPGSRLNFVNTNKEARRKEILNMKISPAAKLKMARAEGLE